MVKPINVNSQSWLRLSWWYGETTIAQRRLAHKLAVAATIFSIAMYFNALVSTQGIALSWVIAVDMAVIVGVVQNYRTFHESLHSNQLTAAAGQVLAVWLGLYAAVLCGAMALIVFYKGVTFTVVDVSILVINGVGCVASLAVYVLLGRAWSKFSLFMSLKVLPQCGQSFLLLAVGTNSVWIFYLVFLGAAFYQGKLRLDLARDAYEKNKSTGTFVVESLANYWSWRADLFSFCLMFLCWLVALLTGGIFPEIQSML